MTGAAAALNLSANVVLTPIDCNFSLSSAAYLREMKMKCQSRPGKGDMGGAEQRFSIVLT